MQRNENVIKVPVAPREIVPGPRAPATRSEVARPVFLERLDHAAFGREIRALGHEIRSNLGEADHRHMLRMERWGRFCTAVGYLFAWLAPNPVSAMLICQGRTTRWLLGHHIRHRGYDKVPGVPERYTSRKFGRGARRFIDWFDWWIPDAWDHMHTTLHHYNTSDPMDADLVEPAPGRNRFVRTMAFLWAAITWKWSYYSFYTTRELIDADGRRGRQAAVDIDGELQRPKMRAEPCRVQVRDLFDFRQRLTRIVWWRCLLPFGLFQFVLVPALFLPLGAWAVFSVLINVVAADILCNLQGFICNRPSHTGGDLYRFEDSPRGKTEFYVRQILASTNYRHGAGLLNFVQFWINYQVEHHLWPNLPMLKYQEYAPRVRAVCEKYGLPYTQESIWRRLMRVYNVSMGRAVMPFVDTSFISRDVRQGRRIAEAAERAS